MLRQGERLILWTKSVAKGRPQKSKEGRESCASNPTRRDEVRFISNPNRVILHSLHTYIYIYIKQFGEFTSGGEILVTGIKTKADDSVYENWACSKTQSVLKLGILGLGETWFISSGLSLFGSKLAVNIKVDQFCVFNECGMKWVTHSEAQNSLIDEDANPVF